MFPRRTRAPPIVTETPTEPPTETPTELPAETPTDVTTGVPTEPLTPTELPSETATATEVPTDTPTETTTAVPTQTFTPTATATGTETPGSEALANIQVSCFTTTGRITLVYASHGQHTIRIESVAAMLNPTTVFPVNYDLIEGRSLSLFTGPTANQYGASHPYFVLTLSQFFQASAYELDGVILTTSEGTIRQNCATGYENPFPDPPKNPPADYLTYLSITVSCNTKPETTFIKNISSVDVSLLSMISWGGDPTPSAYLGRVLRPGESVTYLTGPSAASAPQSSTVIFASSEEFYTDTEYENDRLRLETGFGYYQAACPAKGKPPAPNTGPTINLRVTLNCRSNPETTRIDNLGTKPVYISLIASIQNPARLF